MLINAVKIFRILAFCSLSSFSLLAFANDVRERIDILERRIFEIERRMRSEESMHEQRVESESSSPSRQSPKFDEPRNPFLEPTDRKSEESKILSQNNDEEIQELYSLAVKDIRNQQYDSASENLTRIINEKKSEVKSLVARGIVADSYYLLGEIAFKNRNYEVASEMSLNSYNEFSKMNKSDVRSAYSLLQLSKSLSSMEKKEGACNSLRKIHQDFKSVPSALQEKIDIEITKLRCGSIDE